MLPANNANTETRRLSAVVCVLEVDQSGLERGGSCPYSAGLGVVRRGVARRGAAWCGVVGRVDHDPVN